VGAVKREALAFPTSAQNLKCFFSAADAGFDRNFEGVEVGPLIADADAKDEGAR